MNDVQSKIPQTTQEFARDQRETFLKICRDLVEMETPSDEPATIEPAFTYLSNQFNELGYCTRILPGNDTAGCLYATPPKQERQDQHQLLLGHVDTVWPTGTLDDRPFRVEDDQARGPGVFDMKSGLTQILIALRCLRVLEESPSMTPVVLINSDEEIGSPESTRIIKRLARSVDRALVLEPSMSPGGVIKTARKGLGHFTITLEGTPSHAGLSPEKGQSAIVELSHVIQKINELNDPEEGITVNVGVIEGGSRSNVVAAQGTAEVDVRVLSHQQADELEKAIRSVNPENENVQITVEGGFRRPPMERTDANRQLWETVRQAGNALGLELEEGRSGGGSDGNLTSQYTPTIDGLGAVGGGAHEENEYIDIPKVLDRTALLSLVLTME